MPLWLKRIQYWLLRQRINLHGRLHHPQVAKGDRFRVVRTLRTRALVQWKAPFTSGFECVIPEGTVLVVDHDSAPISTGFGCVAENAAELEAMLVPEQDMKAEKYAGYYFVVAYKHIGKELEQCT